MSPMIWISEAGVVMKRLAPQKKLNPPNPTPPPPHMNISPYPQRLCPRTPWEHPPWTQITAPHLPMIPVEALRGTACFHHSPSPCFGRRNGTHGKIERWAGPRDLRWPPFHHQTQQPTEGRMRWEGGMAMRCGQGATRGEDSFLSFGAANGAIK
jgi:hypothetical protein